MARKNLNEQTLSENTSRLAPSVDNRHTRGYFLMIMDISDWSDTQNELLKKERGVSYEEVILAVEQDRVLDILEHPNQEKYPGQQILIVEIRDYAHIVPFIEAEMVIFLKTIIPSRKMTKIYLKGATNAKDET